MKQILIVGVLMVGLLGLNAAAQDWHREREGHFRGEEWRMHLFEHVRYDLEHINSAAFAAPRERRRLDNTRRELADLQGKMERRFFDQRELNDAIDSLVKSSNDQRLSPQDREVLADDVRRLREFREHHDEWWRR